MCSDRLDADFPDIDLSQLDTSDFDSVNCLSELQWCNDQPVDASPASVPYSATDELFEVRRRRRGRCISCHWDNRCYPNFASSFHVDKCSSSHKAEPGESPTLRRDVPHGVALPQWQEVGSILSANLPASSSAPV